MASFLVENALCASITFKMCRVFRLCLTESLSPFICLSLATSKTELLIFGSQICILEISLQ